MDIAITVFEFVVLLFSAVLHEVAHGFAAERLGDDTARRAGRLTLNPLVHIDLFGSILMPVFLFLASGGAFFFAAAKPVPYDPGNLKEPRKGSALIALAGPGTNFLLAIIFGIIIRAAVFFPVSNIFLSLMAIIVYLNIVLGVFNLIPIPPLDGSRVLFAILPPTQMVYRIMYFLERYGMIIVIFFAFFGFELLIPLLRFLFVLFAGQQAPF